MTSTGTARHRNTRVIRDRRISVEFLIIRIATTDSMEVLRRTLTCVRDIVESLLCKEGNRVTVLTIQRKIEELFPLESQYITIPFMFPSTASEEIRRALWPRCIQLMEMAGAEHLISQQLSSVEQQSLEESTIKVALATKRMCDGIRSIRYDRAYKGKKRKRDRQCCAVCLSNFRINSKVKKLPHCGHIFHSKCIDMCFRKTAMKCPICRDPVQLS
jgi:hypothetical protein